ncbi:MAG: metallopeptidase [Chloroflexi bacterium]|nr:metallopeptidase [Chloroflexota bacterium]
MITEVEQSKQAEKLARDILILSRNTLLVTLRFLDVAISQLKLKPMEEIPSIAIDGQFLYFNTTWHVLNNYKLQKENTVRDYLHVIYHCLFHHPFINKLVHQGCWDLACDIATENAINELGINSVSNARQSRQGKLIAELKKELTLMTAEKVYRFYLDREPTDEKLEALRLDFYADDHSIWYKPLPQEKGETDRKAGSGEDGDGGEENLPRKSLNEGEGSSTSRSQGMMALWKQISERAQVDIETASRQWGDQKGGLHQGLNQINREKFNYASFLQKFSVLGEVMQINDDEFDVIFYTYGLSLYQNMPLIEPLEYKDVKRIKEFVIAIDTSGSVQGKTVQAFVQKTYNILKQTEIFFYQGQYSHHSM